MIEIRNVDGSVLYTAKSATDVRQALQEAVAQHADLSGANLYGANLSEANLREAALYGADFSRADLRRANLREANLSGANLSGADLYGANLYGANLYGANLSGANLSRADLYGANLYGANLYGANLSRADLYGAILSGANLSRADLSGANLSGAISIAPELSTDLLLLLDQVGKIRAYKLVTSDLRSPINDKQRLKYEIGSTVEVKGANTDTKTHCAAGVNVATLPWCLRNWRPGYRVLIVEFTRKDIAVIPSATDGKFRLHRCKVVGEKEFDPVALGLVKDEA